MTLIFDIYLTIEFFELSFNPRYKIGWSPGHLDRVFVNSSPATTENKNEKSNFLVLQKGEKLIPLLKKSLKINLPENIVTNSAYSADRLCERFNIKAQTKKKHQHDVFTSHNVLKKSVTKAIRVRQDTGYHNMLQTILNEATVPIFLHYIDKEQTLPCLED